LIYRVMVRLGHGGAAPVLLSWEDRRCHPARVDMSITGLVTTNTRRGSSGLPY